MAKYQMINVSDEVVDILRLGGLRCEVFLEQVRAHQKDINRFCRLHNLEFRGIDVSSETGKEEPAYNFSDKLGNYLHTGLRAS